jgi:hypothetical protein
MAEEPFNEIFQDYQIFSNEIWTAIRGLRYDAEVKEKAYTERGNRINVNRRLLKGGDD